MPAPATGVAAVPSEKTIHLATKCADEDEFVRRFHPFAGSEALAIPGAVPADEGTQGRFVISLRDQRPIMRGRCRVGAKETSPDGSRTRVLLTLLEQDPRSRRVHDRLLSRRRVMGMDVTPVPVLVPKKNASLKLGGAAAARESDEQEIRTPGSAYQLPANPLSHLQAADLASFVECTLFEEPTAAPPAEGRQGTVEAQTALPPEGEPASVEKGRTKLFYGAGANSDNAEAGDFDQLPTQPQEPSPLLTALSRQQWNLDQDLPAPKRAQGRHVDDELTTPGFDNPNSAIRHLFLSAGPSEPTEREIKLPPPPAVVAAPQEEPPNPPAPFVFVPPSASASARKQSALPTPSAIPGMTMVTKLWSTIPISVHAPLKKWGPTAAIAIAMFCLGFGARGGPAKPPLQVSASASVASHSPEVTVLPLPPPLPQEAPAAIADCRANIRSVPSGAGVKWGDQVLGRTPLVGVTVPCGTATLAIERMMFEPHEAEVTAQPDTETNLNVRLHRLQSRLDISSEPTGAMVVVNQRRVGLAPQVVKVPRGQVAVVQLLRAGFRPVARRVTPGEEAVEVAVTLQPAVAGGKKKVAAKAGARR